MIEQARKIVNFPNAHFIVAPAEELAKHVNEPVDRIICNAAFWQFRDQSAALRSVKKLLKLDGTFVFSLPQQFYDMPGESHRGLIVRAILGELETRGYKNLEQSFVPKFTKETITKLLSDNELEIQRVELVDFPASSLDDGLAFFTIPAVAPFFENVPAEVQTEVLNLAKEKLKDTYIETPNRWAFIMAKNLVRCNICISKTFPV